MVDGDQCLIAGSYDKDSTKPYELYDTIIISLGADCKGNNLLGTTTLPEVTKISYPAGEPAAVGGLYYGYEIQ